MSVDSHIFRLSTIQFQAFLDEPEAFERPEIAENEYHKATKKIADDADIGFLYINEHPLSMFASVADGESIFNVALIEGHDSLDGKYGTSYAYLSPEEVKEMAAELAKVTPAELRELFEMNTGLSAEEFAEGHPESYPDVDALLTRQAAIYQNILRFYTQAANAGDAVLIQFE